MVFHVIRYLALTVVSPTLRVLFVLPHESTIQNEMILLLDVHTCSVPFRWLDWFKIFQILYMSFRTCSKGKISDIPLVNKHGITVRWRRRSRHDYNLNWPCWIFLIKSIYQVEENLNSLDLGWTRKAWEQSLSPRGQYLLLAVVGSLDIFLVPLSLPRSTPHSPPVLEDIKPQSWSNDSDRAMFPGAGHSLPLSCIFPTNKFIGQFAIRNKKVMVPQRPVRSESFSKEQPLASEILDEGIYWIFSFY